MTNAEKIVVITGASSGIGRASALEFARMGYAVVLGARREQALNALAEECRRIGGQAIAFPLDVTFEKDVKNLAETAIRTFGRVDVWINNAAVSLLGRLEDTPMEDIKRVIEINLFGYIHGAKAIIPHFREMKKGILINVASIVGVTGQPYSLAYTTSKFAVRGMSTSLQQELSDEKDIHVCTVMPGVIDTPLFQQAGNYMGREVQAPGKAKNADEVAKAIVDLTFNPKKEIVIGAYGRIPAYLTRTFVPGFLNKKIRQKTFKMHFSEEPSHQSKGNLFEPMKEYASISGGWQQEEHNSNGKKLAIVGAIAAGAAAGAALIMRSAQKRNAEKFPKNIGELRPEQ